MLDRPAMQRVRGEARVALGRAGLRDLRQAGSAKAMLPRVDGDVPEVVFLNTAGGVTSGDRLDYASRSGRAHASPGRRRRRSGRTARRTGRGAS